MIKLVVQPYCHSCPDFEVDVEKPTVYYANFEECETVGDTMIFCEHRDRCRRMMEHLKAELEEHKEKD